ncbi:MAG: hypothetical protein HYU29_02805 [Chloroflexi bacterium]|nr:hypothetical protein [Chloroflexota bacterium]
MAIPLGIKAVAEAYDFIVAQLVPNPNQWPRLYDVLPDWPWERWVLISLWLFIVFFVEGVYRRFGKQPSGFREILTRLSEHTVMYGENNTISVDRVFGFIGDRMARGLRAGIWSVPIFDDVIGKGWREEGAEEAFKWLLLEGLVAAHRIEPAKADAMPYTVYHLTEQGRLVYQWLSQARKPESRTAGSQR